MIKYVFILCICIYLYGYTHVYIYIYANVLPLAFSNASSCFYGLLKVVPMEVNSQGSWVALGLEGWKGRRFWDVMFPRFPKSKNYPLQTKNHIYCSLTVFLELCVEIERVLVFFVAVSKSLKTNTHTHTHTHTRFSSRIEAEAMLQRLNTSSGNLDEAGRQVGESVTRGAV